MEVLKKLDRRKIKPRFIGTKEEKAKGQGKVVMINVVESSLDILRSKKALNNIQYYTALKYRRLWEKSRIGSYTSNFNKIGDITGWNDIAIDRIDAIYKLSRLHTWLGDYAIYQVDRSYLGKRFREAVEELKTFLDQSYD